MHTSLRTHLISASSSSSPFGCGAGDYTLSPGTWAHMHRSLARVVISTAAISFSSYPKHTLDVGKVRGRPGLLLPYEMVCIDSMISSGWCFVWEPKKNAQENLSGAFLHSGQEAQWRSCMVYYGVGERSFRLISSMILSQEVSKELILLSISCDSTLDSQP